MRGLEAKYNPSARGDDEPVFMLRAQDILAPMIVRFWAVMAEHNRAPTEKVRGAEQIADLMERWQKRNSTRVKVPD